MHHLIGSIILFFMWIPCHISSNIHYCKIHSHIAQHIVPHPVINHIHNNYHYYLKESTVVESQKER